MMVYYPPRDIPTERGYGDQIRIPEAKPLTGLSSKSESGPEKYLF
jgi:hypothetical protein